MKKVLLLGGNSFTGSHIVDKLESKYDILSISRNGDLNTFDLTLDSINKVENIIIDNEIEVVINCISDGNVDSCEVNKDFAKLINLDFVQDLVDIQNKLKFKLIHLSTNAVYDGLKSPYNEISEHSPINYYGKIKSEADSYVISKSKNYCILRPITMYGKKLKSQRDNPFSFFYNQLKNNAKIIAVNDIYVNMLFIDDLISCIDNVISNDVRGVFNISGSDIVNRVEFIKIIKNNLDDSSSYIESVPSSYFNSLAPRPLNTSFDNTKMINELGVVPTHISDAISKLLEDI